jgi:hypothetical protein
LSSWQSAISIQRFEILCHFREHFFYDAIVNTLATECRLPNAERSLTTNSQRPSYNIGITMSPLPDDLAGLKDDMIAFIEGHGMSRFPGFVDYEEIQCVSWKTDGNPEGWKDFVELAKTAGAKFLTMDSWCLERPELDAMIERLGSAEFTSDEDIEEARWLRTYVGKTGFVQLGFANQGVMMVYEASTAWYERYQNILEMAEEFAGLPMDEPDDDES